jgi:hypothetical protein
MPLFYVFVYRKENDTGSQAKVRIEIGEDGEEYNYDDQENPGKTSRLQLPMTSICFHFRNIVLHAYRMQVIV